jgi:hypothetical protein
MPLSIPHANLVDDCQCCRIVDDLHLGLKSLQDVNKCLESELPSARIFLAEEVMTDEEMGRFLDRLFP